MPFFSGPGVKHQSDFIPVLLIRFIVILNKYMKFDNDMQGV